MAIEESEGLAERAPQDLGQAGDKGRKRPQPATALLPRKAWALLAWAGWARGLCQVVGSS